MLSSKTLHPLVKGIALATTALIASGVSAQEAPDASEVLEEVVVTGTLIRGLQPVGKQPIAIDEATIMQLGANSTNELLGSIPQVANFFNQRPEQDPRGAVRNSVNRPNLRNLPGINSASGATTSILVNGSRMTSVGVTQSSFDPDFIPTIVMDRVEIITDGGSSLYGADAVGGVINFVTKKEFEGVKVDFGYDVGDDYDGWTASIMAGTKWDGGSGYIALATSDRGEVLNGDRDYAATGIWSDDGSTLTPSDAECINPLGSQTTYRWIESFGVWTDNPLAGAGTVAVGEPCDTDAGSALLPEQDRDWVYAGLVHDFSDSVSLDVKAYYASRDLALSGYPRGATVSDPPPPADGGGAANFEAYIQNNLSFSYGANAAYSNVQDTVSIETIGITPVLNVRLNDDWRLTLTGHYGESDNESTGATVNVAAQTDAIENGLLDPINVAAADAATIETILDYGFANESKQEMFYIQAVVDGSLFSMAAGDVKAAIGTQYTDEDARYRTGDYIGGVRSGAWGSNSREISSVFAEVSIPLLENLDLSLSARYDDYSDFGDTTNPSIGLTFRPIGSLELFANWNESFNAPTVMDPLVPGRIQRYIPFAAGIVPDGGQRDPERRDALLAEGAGGELRPQTAETWSVGFRVEPVDGLKLSATYYSIEFNDLLGQVNPTSAAAVQLNPDKFIFNPTDQQLADFLGEMVNGDDFTFVDAARLGVIVDRRTANTKQAELEGLDFSVSYMHDTSFGLMSYGLAGNYQLDFELGDKGNVVDQLNEDVSDLNMVASVGWQRDNLGASLRVKYSAGFDTGETAPSQSSVDDFVVADLQFGVGLTDALTLSVNVNNVFDEDPPLWRRNSQPAYGFWTLGRVFKISASMTF